MIPFLTYPLALIAATALPALAAIYILRHKFRRKQVSSLMLWRFRVQSKEGGAKVHRLQLPLLFFLELLALKDTPDCRPGGKWAPRDKNWFFAVIEHQFNSQGEFIIEQHRAEPVLPTAPGSIKEAWMCKCGVRLNVANGGATCAACGTKYSGDGSSLLTSGV